MGLPKQFPGNSSNTPPESPIAPRDLHLKGARRTHFAAERLILISLHLVTSRLVRGLRGQSELPRSKLLILHGFFMKFVGDEAATGIGAAGHGVLRFIRTWVTFELLGALVVVLFLCFQLGCLGGEILGEMLVAGRGLRIGKEVIELGFGQLRSISRLASQGIHAGGQDKQKSKEAQGLFAIEAQLF
jgi:hypothetical protein